MRLKTDNQVGKAVSRGVGRGWGGIAMVGGRGGGGGHCIVQFTTALSKGRSQNKGFSRPRHLEGKGCKTGLCRRA